MPLFLPPTYPEAIEQSPTLGGTVITSTGVDTKGTWTSVIASTALDSYGLWTMVHGMHTTATDTSGLLDIGVGPTDPPQIVVPDWNVGACQTSAAVGGFQPKSQFWPIFIPAGSKIWARLASKVSADAVNLKVALCQNPPFGQNMVGSIVAYGVVPTGSKGTNCTSGVGVFGTPVSLGTTTEAHKWWAIGLDQGADTTNQLNLGLRAGLTITTATTGPIGEWEFNETATEVIGGPFPPFPIYQPVPAGTVIAGRVACAAADVHGIIAYGMS